MMTPIVELKEVVLEVEGKRYLDGVSCAFGQGETVVIGGAPGCGKSFFPRLLLGMPGLQEADRLRLWGDVLIDGISVFSMGREALLRQRREMGMVMANGGLVDNMDVERNVSLPLAYHGNDGGDLNIESRCAEVLDAVGIPERQRKGIRPVSLNREERVRVAVGRALVTKPRIFMVDDALVGLDQVATDQLVRILCGPQTKDADLRLLTTSRLAPFLWKADHFFLLVGGKLIYLGGSEEVVEHAHPWVKKDREGITLPI